MKRQNINEIVGVLLNSFNVIIQSLHNIVPISRDIFDHLTMLIVSIQALMRETMVIVTAITDIITEITGTAII